MSDGILTSPELRDVSTNGSPIYTLFDVETVDELTADHILRLAAGVLGAVRIRNFAPLQDCADVMASLETCELGAYDEALIYPRIAKLGPAAYDFYSAYGLDKTYWEHAEQSRATRSTLLRGGDPMDVAVERLQRAWGGELIPATSGGRPMFSGMIREITKGAKIHFDEIVREFPGAMDAPPASFLTFNWYLSMPSSGGETVVHRHRWQPSDEQYRDGYGYVDASVEGLPSVTVAPETGDAILFDSRNFHAVLPVDGEGRRVSLSFFLGVTGRGPLALWS
ncbi:putative 2OG-Fe(II) oxygenase [Kitasatospora sp. NPDC059673]|uniref:2OG-Fe(II)-dependent halogenase WelO5 family protein n=1 Tax=Kitasatospora sp. NPDC059673 TaxID=3346901 RepID=UPI0036C5E23B